VRFDVEFLPERSILSVRAKGAGGPDSVHEMVTAIHATPEFVPGMPILIDGFGTTYAPNAQEASELPGIFQAQLPGSRLALVVRAGGAQYSVACLVETIAGRRDVPFAVFPDRDEAIRWLTAP
jgi:hypothetical protein